MIDDRLTPVENIILTGSSKSQSTPLCRNGRIEGRGTQLLSRGKAKAEREIWRQKGFHRVEPEGPGRDRESGCCWLETKTVTG